MITVDQGALRITLFNMRQTGKRAQRIGQAAVKAAGTVLREKVRQNISLSDHTLDDLAELDHPYARRHGGITIHRGGSASLAHPELRVHRQSGRLLSALTSQPSPTQPGWRVSLDDSIAPQARYVIQGTRVMSPRDIIVDTALGALTQRDMMRAIVRVMGKQFRTQGSVRFGAAPSGSP